MSHLRRLPSVAGPINLGLIVTPMLDVAFQILAFFIMTYHPSALEAHIPGRLALPENPAVVGKPPPDATEIPPSIDEPNLLMNEAILIKIKAVGPGQQIGSRREGDPSQLFIQRAQDVQPEMLADVAIDLEVALSRLDTRLREMLRQGTAAKADLRIVAESDLRQQYVMAVYDTCKKAGFDQIHFVPPPILPSKLTR